MQRVPLSIEVKKVLKMLVYTLSAMVLSISAYFFINTSSTAEKGYSMKENQVRRQELEDQNRILEQRLLEVQSIKALKNSSIVQDMVESKAPIYIEARGPLTRGKVSKKQFDL